MANDAATEARKGRGIARCLGYRDIGPRAIASGEDDGTAAASALEGTDAHTDGVGVDLWRLRALALQPGGLLSSRGRKLSWIKLAGVDALVFRKEHANVRLGAPENGLAYNEIQKALEEEMEVSRWHVQRERRALRKQAKRDDRAARSSSGGDLASTRGRSRGMSHASSVNTLSSLASFESENDLSTPLAANLSGTPKSFTFKGVELDPSKAAGAGVSFTAFATSKSNGTTSPASACPSLASLDTARLSPASSEESSPSITSPPRALAEGQPAAQFQWSLAPRKYNLQQYKKQSNEAPARVQKDRRRQERRVLVQIVTSAFYLLQYEQDEDFTPVHIKCCPGLSDLIAVLLLHLESPSLTSLLLKQILKSHLRMYRAVENVSSDESFESCLDEIQSEDVDTAEDRDWDVLSLGFFPLLQLLDGELHSGLWVEDEQSFLRERVFVFGDVLQQWTSSWFCCHQALSLGVVSRLVDLFLASHPSMPLYLSTAMLCHPTHRAELLALAQHPSPFSSGSLLASLLGSLLSDLPREVAVEDNCTEPLVAFVEQSISTAISFMRRVPPQSLASLVADYQNGILLPHISTGGLESMECTWTKRSLAPTDYNMVRRMFTDTAIEESPLSSDLSTEYQMALIASGLAVVDSNKEEGRGIAWKRPEMMTSRRAIVLGMALCAGVKLLQLHNTPPSSEAIGSFAGDSSADSIGMALLVGIQALVLPLTKLEPPQSLDLDEEVPAIDLSGNEFAGSVGTSPFIADQQPVVLINAEVLHDIFSSAPTSKEELLVQALEDSTEAVLSPDNSATSRTISLLACEDEFDEETSLDGDAVPSRSVSSGPAALSPYAIRDDLEEVIDKLNDLLLDTIAATETREFMSTLPDHGESADPDGQLLDPITKKGGPKRPAVSIPNKVKSYASRSRKLGAGIKKRLRGWKREYILLAEGDIMI